MPSMLLKKLDASADTNHTLGLLRMSDTDSDEDTPGIDALDMSPYFPEYLNNGNDADIAEGRRAVVLEILRLSEGSIEREWRKEAEDLEEFLRSGKVSRGKSTARPV